MALAPIKKWKFKHEQIVALHLAGYQNERIADELRITPTRVSQVLQDPKALQIIRAAQSNFREQVTEDLAGRMLMLAEVSARRVGETLNAEFALGTKPKMHQDTVGLTVLKGTGFLAKDMAGDREEKMPQMSPALVERLTAALEKANEAEEMRRLPETHAEVV